MTRRRQCLSPSPPCLTDCQSTPPASYPSTPTGPPSAGNPPASRQAASIPPTPPTSSTHRDQPVHQKELPPHTAAFSILLPPRLIALPSRLRRACFNLPQQAS